MQVALKCKKRCLQGVGTPQYAQAVGVLVSCVRLESWLLKIPDTKRNNPEVCAGTAITARKGISSLPKSFFVSSQAAKPRGQFFLPSFQLAWQLVQVHAATVQLPGWCEASHCLSTRWLSVGEPHLCFLGSWGYWFQMR